MTSLDLTERGLRGSIDPQLGRLGNLTRLKLSNNRLGGPIPAELGQLHALTSLNLSYNRLTGPIPAELGQLSHLRFLSLRRNELTGPVPETFGQLTGLVSLYLDRNRLSGPIPEQLGNLTRLSYFDISNNRLPADALATFARSLRPSTGSGQSCLKGAALSAWIAHSALAKDCQALLAARDVLTGTEDSAQLNWSPDVPMVWWDGVTVSGDPMRVTGVRLQGHGLSGSLPEQLGQLHSLVYLYLNDNRLTGSIPQQLGQLDNLVHLYLNDNRLTGSIPEEVRELSKLRGLSVHGNPLTDELGPVSPIKLRNLDVIRERDPTSFRELTYKGKYHREMFDRRAGSVVDVEAFVFDASYVEGMNIEVRVNAEFGSQRRARSEAWKYADVIGRLPALLRAGLGTVSIHSGTRLFGGGSRGLLIYSSGGLDYEERGVLEEVLVHEAVHAALDRDHRRAEAWLAAQEKDGRFISAYARDHPWREDLAESFLAYIAVRYRSNRIPTLTAEAIRRTIPNRIAYFDDQPFDGQWCPIVIDDCPAQE